MTTSNPIKTSFKIDFLAEEGKRRPAKTIEADKYTRDGGTGTYKFHRDDEVIYEVSSYAVLAIEKRLTE